MIVNTMTKSVDLGEVIREYKAWIFLLEVGNDLVDSRRKLQEQRMVNELDKAVER